MNVTQFGVLSWNWCVWTANRDHDKVALMDRLHWSVALLQETATEALARIALQFPEAEIASGRDLTNGLYGTDPAYGASVVTRNGARILDSGLVPFDGTSSGWRPDSEPMPESMVWAHIQLVDRTELLAVAAHAPHSAGSGDDQSRRVQRKVRTYKALEQWLRDQSLPVVVGIDGNCWIDGGVDDLFGEPSVPRGPQEEVNRFFYDGPERHGVRDVYRDWLFEDRARLQAVQQRRPNGPLAVTYVRGTTRKVADRFDAILASPDVKVRSVEHSYEDAVSAGSDHSYVCATLEVDR